MMCLSICIWDYPILHWLIIWVLKFCIVRQLTVHMYPLTNQMWFHFLIGQWLYHRHLDKQHCKQIKAWKKATTEGCISCFPVNCQQNPLDFKAEIEWPLPHWLKWPERFNGVVIAILFLLWSQEDFCWQFMGKQLIQPSVVAFLHALICLQCCFIQVPVIQPMTNEKVKSGHCSQVEDCW